MLKSYNLNDYVYVEINDVGWDVLEKHWKTYASPSDVAKDIAYYKESKTKTYIVDGNEVRLTQFQLHELIRDFGAISCFAGSTPFKGCCIYMDAKYLVPAPAVAKASQSKPQKYLVFRHKEGMEYYTEIPVYQDAEDILCKLQGWRYDAVPKELAAKELDSVSITEAPLVDGYLVDPTWVLESFGKEVYSIVYKPL